MSQCKASTEGDRSIWYCVLNMGHRGRHKFDTGAAVDGISPRSVAAPVPVRKERRLSKRLGPCSPPYTNHDWLPDEATQRRCRRCGVSDPLPVSP